MEIEEATKIPCEFSGLEIAGDFSYLLLPCRKFVAQDDVVGTAFHDADRGDEGELRFFLQLFDAEGSAVAHRGAHL